MNRKLLFPILLLLLAQCARSQVVQTVFRTATRLPASYAWLAGSRSRINASVQNPSGAQVLDSRTQPLAPGSSGKVEMGVGLLPALNPERVNSTTAVTLSEPALACTRKNISLDLLTGQDFSILKASLNSKIYPGAFFHANSVINQAYTFYSAPPRKPIRAVIDLPAYRPNGLREIVLDNPGTFQNLKFDSLRSTNFGIPLPAFIGVSSDHISARLELAAKLDASAGIFLPLEEFDLPVDISLGEQGSGNVQASGSLNFFLFKLVQPMFTISIQSPNPSDWFQDPEAHRALTDGVMVNAVTYGRMVFLMVSSFATQARVQAAVQAKLGLTFTGETEIKLGDDLSAADTINFSSVINSFKAVIIGGNGSAGNRVVTDVTQLKSYITQPSAGTLSASTGAMPISYSLVRISDNSNVSIRSTANYEVVEDCQPLSGYAVFIRSLSPSKVVDNPLTGNTEDLFGSISVSAFYTKPDGSTVSIREEQGRPASVFTRSDASPLQLKEKEVYTLYRDDNSITDGKRRFLFTPDQIGTGYILVRVRLKDKIMQDGEQLGNPNASVSYEERELKFFLKDWANVPAGACSLELKEVNGDARLCLSFSTRKD